MISMWSRHLYFRLSYLTGSPSWNAWSDSCFLPHMLEPVGVVTPAPSIHWAAGKWSSRSAAPVSSLICSGIIKKLSGHPFWSVIACSFVLSRRGCGQASGPVVHYPCKDLHSLTNVMSLAITERLVGPLVPEVHRASAYRLVHGDHQCVACHGSRGQKVYTIHMVVRQPIQVSHL